MVRGRRSMALDYFKELTQRTQRSKGYLEENNVTTSWLEKS